MLFFTGFQFRQPGDARFQPASLENFRQRRQAQDRDAPAFKAKSSPPAAIMPPV
jgi:hypothetical protein